MPSLHSHELQVPRVVRVRVAVFAHNEAQGIGEMLADLMAQSVFGDGRWRLGVDVLCNGCTDDTAARAQAVTQGHPLFTVFDWPAGGKALTWNRWVAEQGSSAEILVFADADIRLPDSRVLAALLEELQQGTAVAVTSEPRKHVADVASPLLRFLATRVVTPHEDGRICGQLYAVWARALEHLRLPVPCLVEDGFLAAALCTDCFQAPPRPGVIRASHNAWHTFEPPLTLPESFRHSVRLELGTEMNAALFTRLWQATTLADRHARLAQFASGEGIGGCLDEHDRAPQRRYLRLKSVLKRAYGTEQMSLARKLVGLPWRVVRLPYDIAVFGQARRLYRRRTFRW